MEPSGFMKFFEGVDLGVMAAIGVVGIICRRVPQLGTLGALGVCFLLGAVWGVVEAMGANAPALATIVKGAFMNSAGAVVASRLADVALVKAGLAKPINGGATPPPTEEKKDA